MARVAISYRREDCAGIARLIYERLALRYGAESVFIDFDAIEFGEDFRDRIFRALAQTDFFLVLIGPRWLGTRPDGHNRIENSDDPVRVEIEKAFDLGLRAAVVRMEQATMPAAGALPTKLRALSLLPSFEVHSGADVNASVDVISRHIGETFPETSHQIASSSSLRQSFSPIINRFRMIPTPKFAKRKSSEITMLRAVIVGCLAVVQIAAPFVPMLEHFARYGFRYILLLDSALLATLGFSWWPFFVVGSVGLTGTGLLEAALAPSRYDPWSYKPVIAVTMLIFVFRGLLEATLAWLLSRSILGNPTKTPGIRGYKEVVNRKPQITLDVSAEIFRSCSAILWTAYLCLGYFLPQLISVPWLVGYDVHTRLLAEVQTALIALLLGIPCATLMYLTARKLRRAVQVAL